MKEEIERNLKILVHLSEGAREEEEAQKNNIRQQAIHQIAERTLRKLMNDNEQINYLSVRGALIQQPEIKEIAKSTLERLRQLKLRGQKLPHKFTIQALQSLENLQ